MNKAVFFLWAGLPAVLSAQTYEDLIATPDLGLPASQNAQKNPQGILPPDLLRDKTPPANNTEKNGKKNLPRPLVQTREVIIQQPVYIDQIVEVTNYITNYVGAPPVVELSNKTTVNIENTVIQNVYTTQPLSPDIFTAVYYGRLDDVRMFLERRIYGANAVYNDGNSLLHLAVYRPETLTTALYLIEQGADLNKTNRLRQTPLHIAVLRSNLPAVELLVSRKASVSQKDAVGQTPLWLANIMGQADMLKILAAAYQNQNPDAPLPANVKTKGFPNVPTAFDLFSNRYQKIAARPLNNSPWHQALYRPGIQGAVDLVLRGYSPKNPDANGQNALHVAALYDNIQAAQYLINQGVSVSVKDRFGETPLHIAAGRSSADLIGLFIDYGAGVTDKNNNGWTPLFEAALLGNLPAAEFFLQKGVSPNTRTKTGRTPLHEAALQVSGPDLLIALLDAGAVVHAADKDGKTPLYLAAEAGNIQAAAQLLSRGAPVDIETKEGMTPLHIAVRSGHAGMVQYLMESGGADMFIPDTKGRYPIETAYAKGNDEMIAYLASQYTAAQAKAGAIASTPVILPAQNNTNPPPPPQPEPQQAVIEAPAAVDNADIMDGAEVYEDFTEEALLEEELPPDQEDFF